jgi:glutamine amidotransferase
VTTLRAQHPEVAVLQELSAESRLVVSEPLGDLARAWNEVRESSYGVIQEGDDAPLPFTLGGIGMPSAASSDADEVGPKGST